MQDFYILQVVAVLLGQFLYVFLEGEGQLNRFIMEVGVIEDWFLLQGQVDLGHILMMP